MAHEIIYDEIRGINPIAFVGEVPWHGLGQQLAPDSPLEVWAQAAGMNWEIKSSPVLGHCPEADDIITFEGKQLLYRSDFRVPLSIMSDQYKIVQPMQVLEFFRDLISDAGFKMNTAGVLFGGKKFWALAEIGASVRIMGQDRIDGYCLLSTSCDGSLATTGQFTAVQVVCNNTLTVAVNQANAKNAIKVTHAQQFDAVEMKQRLGLAEESFSAFADKVDVIAGRKVTDKEAVEWLVRVVNNLDAEDELSENLLVKSEAKTVQRMFQLFKGEGKGAHLKSQDGSAWGLVSAVTEYADHHRNTQTPDNKLNSTWFGGMAKLKDRAFTEAIRLAA